MTNALRLRLEAEELRADRQFSVAYLKAALEELDDPDNRAAGLLALRDVAEAYGGLGARWRRRPASAGRRFTARCRQRATRL